jgi:hypothetical protein
MAFATARDRGLLSIARRVPPQASGQFNPDHRSISTGA